MDDVEQLKQDVQEGRINPDRLVGLVVALQRRLQEAHRRIEELECVAKFYGGLNFLWALRLSNKFSTFGCLPNRPRPSSLRHYRCPSGGHGL